MSAHSPQPVGSFDPQDFGFVLLKNFRVDGKVSVYELNNHQLVNGHEDFLRLNLYLTKDGDYVTIWHGLLEPILTEAEFEHGRMEGTKVPDDFSFREYRQAPFLRMDRDKRGRGMHLKSIAI